MAGGDVSPDGLLAFTSGLLAFGFVDEAQRAFDVGR
jgi:hypothetical protein